MNDMALCNGVGCSEKGECLRYRAISFMRKGDIAAWVENDHASTARCEIKIELEERLR